VTNAQLRELNIRMTNLEVSMHRVRKSNFALDLDALADALGQLAGDVDEARDTVYGILNPDAVP